MLPTYFYFTGVGGSGNDKKGKAIKKVSHKRTKYYRSATESENEEEQAYDEAELYARLSNLQTVLRLSPTEYAIMRNLITFDHPKTSDRESFWKREQELI